jgi:type I restriction enzyme S subunit
MKNNQITNQPEEENKNNTKSINLQQKSKMQNHSSANGKAIPQLRFPEFKNDGEWEEKNGNMLFNSVNNKNHNSNMPILAITQEYGAIPRDMIDYRVLVTDKSLESYKVVEVNDFIISLRSFQGGIEYSNYKGICSPAYIVLRKKRNEDVEFFFKYYFKTSNFIKDLNKNIEGIRDGKMISYNQFSDLHIVIPLNPKEQQKIASCLSSLDELIEAQTKKLETLRLHKKGLMQNLFPQEGETTPQLRFPEFKNDGDWEENILGNLCEITTGKLDANAMVDNGQYRFYTCAKDYYLIDKYAFDTDALLISGNGANVGYIHHYKGKFNAYQRTYVLDQFTQNILFIKYYLEQNLSKRISTEKKDGNTPYIVLSTLEDMLIMLPKSSKEDKQKLKSEQQKIASCLSSLDELIEAQTKKLETLRLHKKGLMQQLFPNVSEVK